MTELASDKAYFASLNIPPLFDARKQGYSFDDAKRHLEALGPAARDYYAGVYIPGYDLVFPVTLFAFGILFCLWMTQPTRRFAAALQPASRLAILIIPLGLFIFDILENISVLAMLRSYPDLDPGLASAVSLFSRIKWLSAYSAGHWLQRCWCSHRSACSRRGGRTNRPCPSPAANVPQPPRLGRSASPRSLD